MKFRISQVLLAIGFLVEESNAFVVHSTTRFIPAAHSSINFPSDISYVRSNPSILFGKNEEISEDVAPLESIDLTDEKIAEMLEVTFIKSCLQLATGYVDVLKLFLASTKAAYDRKIPVFQLLQSVADCPTNTANRSLSKEEIDLRSTWIMLSYLTLETIDRIGNGSDDDEFVAIPDDIRDRYGDLVEQKVKENMGLAHGDVKDDFAPLDAQAAAIFAYNMKVVSLTISNVEEAKFANEAAPTIDEDAIGPPIPGRK